MNVQLLCQLQNTKSTVAPQVVSEEDERRGVQERFKMGLHNFGEVVESLFEDAFGDHSRLRVSMVIGKEVGILSLARHHSLSDFWGPIVLF